MYMQASMELGPEDVSLLERCPHFRRIKAKQTSCNPSFLHFLFLRDSKRSGFAVQDLRYGTN